MDCNAENFEIFVQHAILLIGYLTFLSAIHAGIAIYQSKRYGREKLISSKRVFMLSLGVLPVGFLIYRAYLFRKFTGSAKLLVLNLLLLSAFIFSYPLLFKFAEMIPVVKISLNFGIENEFCLRQGFPLSSPFVFINILFNVFALHHLLWILSEILNHAVSPRK